MWWGLSMLAWSHVRSTENFREIVTIGKVGLAVIELNTGEFRFCRGSQIGYGHTQPSQA